MTQRQTRHMRNMHDVHPHSLPLSQHSAAHATRSMSAAAFQETSAPSSHTKIYEFSAPATIHCACHADLPSRVFSSVLMHPKFPPATRNVDRSTQSYARHSAADMICGHAPGTFPARTIPAACHVKRTLAMRVQTRLELNLHGTALQHARGMPATHLQHVRSPHSATLAQGDGFGKPRRRHPAAITEEFRRLGRKIREQFSSKMT